MNSKTMNESFIGNEVMPYLMDAIDQNIDISTRKQALGYTKIMASSDRYAKPVVEYLESIDDKEYKELYKMIKDYK